MYWRATSTNLGLRKTSCLTLSIPVTRPSSTNEGHSLARVSWRACSGKLPRCRNENDITAGLPDGGKLDSIPASQNHLDYYRHFRNRLNSRTRYGALFLAFSNSSPCCH